MRSLRTVGTMCVFAGLSGLSRGQNSEVTALLEMMRQRDAEIQSIVLSYSLEIRYLDQPSRCPKLEIGYWGWTDHIEALAVLSGCVADRPFYERIVNTAEESAQFKAKSDWGLLARESARAVPAVVFRGGRSHGGKLREMGNPSELGLFHLGMHWSEYLGRLSDLAILGRRTWMSRSCVVLLGDMDGTPVRNDGVFARPIRLTIDDRDTLLVLAFESFDGALPDECASPPLAPMSADLCSARTIRTTDSRCWARSSFIEVSEVQRLSNRVYVGSKARFGKDKFSNVSSTIEVIVADSTLNARLPASLIDRSAPRDVLVHDSRDNSEYYEGHKDDPGYTARRRFADSLYDVFPQVAERWNASPSASDDIWASNGLLLSLYAAGWISGYDLSLDELTAHVSLHCPKGINQHPSDDVRQAIEASGIAMSEVNLDDLVPAAGNWFLGFLHGQEEGHNSVIIFSLISDSVIRAFKPGTGTKEAAWAGIAPYLDKRLWAIADQSALAAANEVSHSVHDSTTRRMLVAGIIVVLMLLLGADSTLEGGIASRQS